jgi:hypothetical protein
MCRATCTRAATACIGARGVKVPMFVRAGRVDEWMDHHNLGWTCTVHLVGGKDSHKLSIPTRVVVAE